MRKIKEVLRLKLEQGRTHREISAAVGISVSSVQGYASRASKLGMSWQDVEPLTQAQLEQRLYKRPYEHRQGRWAPVDLQWVHRELKRTGVTLQLLWMEYRAGVDAGQRPYQYSQFCGLYRQFCRRLHPSMRQVHHAGDKAFVDYSGKRPVVVDRQTGEATEVELFVMVLGASNYTYAEATKSQRLSDFIGSNVRAFEYFGCVPSALVPDRLKSAVRGTDWYDPDINATYLEMAQHYGMAVIPARPRRPKDKAKVEAAVLVAQRWILARLRNRTFFSIAELNEAIWELLEDLNNRPFKKLEGCRRSAFESIDRPAMRPLPLQRYQMAEWKVVKVNVDYHIEYDGRLYSVPCTLIRRKVEVRATACTVEVLHGGQRVASHPRSYGPRGTTVTCAEHRPQSHREYGEWTPQRMVGWAATVGPSTAAVAKEILAGRVHPESGYRSCLALIRMAKRYGYERTERASAQALSLRSATRKTVEMILKNNLDQHPITPGAPVSSPVVHDNIRGASYYDGDATAPVPSTIPTVSSPDATTQGSAVGTEAFHPSVVTSAFLSEDIPTYPSAVESTFLTMDLPTIPLGYLPSACSTKGRLPN